MSSDPVRARIGAIRATLEDLGGTPQHAAISRAQSAALLEVLRRTMGSMSAETKADLSTLVVRIPWAQGDDADILDALAPHGRAFPKRKNNQDYLTILEMFTENDWKTAMEADVAPSVPLNVFILRGIRLGLRNPTEYTSRLLCTLWLILTNPNPQNMTEQEKQNSLAKVKFEFHRIADKMANPSEHVVTLPGTAADLLKQHPSIYKSAFTSAPGDGPVRCPLDLRNVWEIDNS